ncbi:MAG TPA: DNA polymerase Y family protein [Xanthobacteraceae bacterium]|jgi:protein ImuB|nr:DNA polymerase Y family protein [Xanthobacteraceae bacterium]
MSASSHRRRYLSVWLRRLTTDRIARASSAPLDQTPLVVVEPVKNALTLVAVNDAAARLGLSTGMTLADARAMYPTLLVADADGPADQRLLVAIADWSDRYTPLVGLDPPDGLMLDITGCAHLFGGEAALGEDIVQRLAGLGFAARAAIADTVGCAWAVARFGHATNSSPPPCGEGSGVGVARYSTSIARDVPLPNPSRQGGRGSQAYAIVPPDGTRAALLPLRLAALRIGQDIEARLEQAGLKRIADVIDRPRAPLAARFGAQFLRRIAQAMGQEDEPITPRLPIPPYVVERRFADPILLEADVLATIELLGGELARMLERRGEGARRLQLALFRTDGKVERSEVGTGAPLRDSARMRALFNERLAALGDDCDPGFGFDVVRLMALTTERCDPQQTGLAEGDQTTELAHLIDRLGARFGLRRLTRCVAQDTHIPEFAVAAMPAAHQPLIPAKEAVRKLVSSDHSRPRSGSGAGSSGNPVSSQNASLSNHQEHLCEETPGPGFRGDERLEQSPSPTRPLRLFGRPEPIEAVAEVPDGPPVRFRWRRVLHQVAHAEGPERIAMEWWRDRDGRALTRDYFRLECRDGIRLWVYREGLYGRELKEPRWYLHGLFA